MERCKGSECSSGRYEVPHLRNNHERYLDYILLPLGYKHNRGLQKAQKGEILDFMDGSSAWVDRVVTMPLKATITDCLCRALYGFPITEVCIFWRRGFKVMGENPKALDDSECLVIFYKEKDDSAGTTDQIR